MMIRDTAGARDVTSRQPGEAHEQRVGARATRMLQAGSGWNMLEHASGTGLRARIWMDGSVLAAGGRVDRRQHYRQK